MTKIDRKDWNNNTIMSSNITKLNKKLINMDQNRQKIYKNEQKSAQLKSAKTDRPIKNDQKSTKNEQNCINLTQIDWNRLTWIVFE